MPENSKVKLEDNRAMIKDGDKDTKPLLKRQSVEPKPEYVVSGAMTYCKASKKLFRVSGPLQLPDAVAYKLVPFYAPDSRRFIISGGIPGVDGDTAVGVNIGREDETEFYGICTKTGEPCRPDPVPTWFQEPVNTYIRETTPRDQNISGMDIPDDMEGRIEYAQRLNLEAKEAARAYLQGKINGWTEDTWDLAHIGIENIDIVKLDYLIEQVEANRPGWLQSTTRYNQTLQALNSARAVLQYILEPVIVNDYQLLTTNAILVCRQGGAIYFADNGQKRMLVSAALANLRAQVRAAILEHYSEQKDKELAESLANTAYVTFHLNEEDLNRIEDPYKLLAWLYLLGNKTIEELQTEVSAGVYSDAGVQPTEIDKFEEEVFLSNYVSAANGPKVEAGRLPLYHPILQATGEQRLVSYGWRWEDPDYYRTMGKHRGVDYRSGVSKYRINATHSGKIIHAGYSTNSESYGNFVCVKDLNDNHYIYAHMLDQSHSVTVGQYVLAGRDLGHVGSTGHSTGSHLHYEPRDTKNNLPVDPTKFMPEDVQVAYYKKYRDGREPPPNGWSSWPNHGSEDELYAAYI